MKSIHTNEIKPPNAVVVVSGDFSEDRKSLGPRTIKRLDKGIERLKSTDAQYLVVAGGYPFRWKRRPPRLIAYLMEEYAIDLDIPEDRILTQAKSKDTIGDALFTKTDVTEPRNLKRLEVVTDKDHLKRTLPIFQHTMGPEYAVKGVSAGATEASGHPLTYIQEVVGDILVKSVLNGTESGDSEAIQARLFDIVPGYAKVPILRRVSNTAHGLAAE